MPLKYYEEYFGIKLYEKTLKRRMYNTVMKGAVIYVAEACRLNASNKKRQEALEMDAFCVLKPTLTDQHLKSFGYYSVAFKGNRHTVKCMKPINIHSVIKYSLIYYRFLCLTAETSGFFFRHTQNRNRYKYTI